MDEVTELEQLRAALVEERAARVEERTKNAELTERVAALVEERAELAERVAVLVAERAEFAERVAVLVAERAKSAERIAKLEAQVAALLEILGKNSSNSNKPPSSDPPSAKQAKKKPKGRQRGGQRGHRGAHRKLVPPEQVDEVIDLFPPECENCCQPLPQVPDGHAKRYQFTDLKPLAAHTTEWRRHAVDCPHCGHRTRAKYDPAVIPRFAFGPRLMAVVGLLTGIYHLSRRQTVRLLHELLGVQISLGSVSAIEKRVSDAVAPAVEEALESARAAPVKHADGTTWLRSGALLSLWVIATAAVTVFKVLPDGQKATLRDKLFGRTCGILVSDRATALKFWTMSRRQVCWAHLIRKFVAYSERDGPAGRLGKELLEYARLMFDYWAMLREGRLSRASFIERMAPVRLQIEAVLQQLIDAEIKGVSGSCADILEHREALWTFVDRVGVEPTNNHAERELRGLVMWRRRSFGSQSERGTLFTTRMMSIAQTVRKQGLKVLDFLVACCTPRPEGTAAPSLLGGT